MVRYLNLTGGELIRKVTKNFQRMVDGQTAVCQGVVESQLIAAHLHKNTFCYSWCNLASQFCSACSCFWSALDAFICQFSWQCSRGAQLLECLTSWVSFFFFFRRQIPEKYLRSVIYLQWFRLVLVSIPHYQRSLVLRENPVVSACTFLICLFIFIFNNQVTKSP